MLKQGGHERRKGIRVDFDTEVTVMSDGMKSKYKGSSRDLSLRSVFIKTDIKLKLDTPCQVEIMLSGLENELVLKMEGHVVRDSNEGYAIFFDSVDLDSYTHLKNIVKYNAADSDMV
ncbi:MAG: PilZ domain-containing protein [Proteobacteria bacterium]|nr:PilZ domain-containing protein [Pseudomonadota bacterium]